MVEPVERRNGVRAAVLAYTGWGLLTIFWKLLEEFDPFELIGWRIVCSSAVMAVVVTVGRRWSELRAALRDRRTVGRLAIAAVLLTGNWTGYVWAVHDDRVLEAALGYFMAPLATMLLGILVLGEPASRNVRAALVLAVASVVVLTISYGRPPWLALVIAATWSLYGLLKHRVPLGPVESLAGETFLLLAPAVVFLAVVGGGADSVPSTATSGQWFLVALTGVVTATPLMLFAYSAQRVPFTLLGALQYLVPTINLVLGWAVYDEEMTAIRLVGFALVWLALVLITLDRISGPTRRAARPAADARSLSPTAGNERRRHLPSTARRALVPSIAAAVAVLVGCGGPPSTRDFAERAVDFIEGDMSRNTQLHGLTFTAAQCDEPASTKAGTEYSCTAMGSDGQQRALTVKVVDRNTLQVTDMQPPPPADGAPTPTTVAPTTGG